MIHYFANFLVALSLLCLVSLNLQAEMKPNLVLLPMDVSEQEVDYESEYGSALQQGLQQRYTVFYGAAVEKELEKEYRKLNCDAETCNQNVAIAFNGELIADSSVKRTSSGYLLKMVIRNVITGKVLETKTQGCRGCDELVVINKLKQIGASTLNDVGSTNQSAVSRVNGQATPMASDARAILIFDSQPTGTAITINGKASGKTPYQGLNHKIGEQLRIELKDPRYRSYELEVSLNQAITQLEPLILEAGQGQVMIVTDPYQANAVVYLDDKAQGAAPVQVNMMTGPHEIYAQAGSQKTEVKTFSLNNGESKQVILRFLVDEAKPIYSNTKNHLPTVDQKREYQQAYDLIKNKNFEEAIKSLLLFIEHYPEGDLAGNAYYWLGEVYLVLPQLEEAKQAFSVVVSAFPMHRKAADALFKLGVSYDRLQDPARAEKYLNEVQLKFPKSTAAKIAKRYKINR